VNNQAGKGSAWRKGVNFKAYNEAPVWDNIKTQARHKDKSKKDNK